MDATLEVAARENADVGCSPRLPEDLVGESTLAAGSVRRIRYDQQQVVIAVGPASPRAQDPNR